MYLANVSTRIAHSSGELYLPPWGVVLQILALPLQHAASNFHGCGMILSRVDDMGDLSEGNSWIDHLIVVRGEHVPFVIFFHCKRTFLQFFCRVVVFIGLAAEDTSQNVVRFLDFTNNNGLQLAAGCFQIEIRL